MKKIILSLMLVMVMMIGCVIPTYAMEDSNTMINEFQISNLKLGETQSHNVILSNGEIGKISITKIADLPNDQPQIMPFGWKHWHTRNNVTDGTYKINVYTVAANAGFTIDVKNYKITDAYDGWHFIAFGNVSASLTLDSSKKATYFMNFGLSIPWVGGPSWTGGVQARIEGKNLVTYWN